MKPTRVPALQKTERIYGAPEGRRTQGLVAEAPPPEPSRLIAQGSTRMRETESHVEEERRPIERELADLRKEVVESRNLVIKTDNFLKNLFAELKAISKKSDDQYKRTWFASAAAYAAFLVLAIGVALLGARASVAGERAHVEAAQAEADLARKRAEDLSAQVARVRQEADLNRAASDRAVAIYKLLTEGDGESRLRGVDDLGKLDRSRLNVLELKALEDKARALKAELGLAAFERGLKAHRREDWKTASSELKRYLTLEPDGTEALQASYLAGTALFALKDWAGAVPLLERFVSHKGLKGADHAFLVLGQAHEALGRWDRAAEDYRRGTAEYPGSDLVPIMQQRFKLAQHTLSTQGGASGASVPATTVTPAPAGTAAPAAPPATPAPAAAAQPPSPAPAAAPVPQGGVVAAPKGADRR